MKDLEKKEKPNNRGQEKKTSPKKPSNRGGSSMGSAEPTEIWKKKQVKILEKNK